MPRKIANKNNLFFKNQQGSVLAYALIIMSIVMIILVSMLSYISSQLKFSFNRVEKEKAFQISEAGVYYYRWYLAHETSGKTALEIGNFLKTGGPMGFSPAVVDYDGIGAYQLTITPPTTGSTMITVTSVGWSYKFPEMKRTISVRFRRPSWSEYAVLANDFMRFGEGTEVYGKIHSNEGIRFDGLAHNVVSSLLPTADDPDHSGANEFGVHTHKNLPPSTTVTDSFRSAEAPPTSPVPARVDVFEAGRQFPAAEVSFNGVLLDLSFMKGIACVYNTHTPPACTVINNCTSAGCYFDNNGVGRQIFLKANGTYEIYTVDSYSGSRITSYLGKKNNGKSCTPGIASGIPTRCVDISGCTCVYSTYNIPNNGIIFVEDNIWLDAKPSGSSFEKLDKSYQGSTLLSSEAKVTIVAGGVDSKVFIGGSNLEYARSDGSNILGVIGQHDVEVIENSLNTLTISGALLAQSGKVGRAYYVDHKSSITVNGSIATNERYGFAYADGTGYTTRILNFDNNLLYYPPPYFPTGTEYAIDLWEEL
jgi:hypothetical protein